MFPDSEPGHPDLSLLALVEQDADILPERWQTDILSAGSLQVELLVLDRRDHADPPIPGFRTIHHPGPFPGPALQAAAEACRGRAIAMLGARARRSPDHLHAALRVLDLQPGIQLVISDFELLSATGSRVREVSLQALSPSPPPGWVEGALFRTRSLFSLSPFAFFPVLLHTYRTLLQAGSVAHIPVLSHGLSEEVFFDRLGSSKAQALWLDHWTEEDIFHAPDLSVIMVVKGSPTAIYPALRGLCQQSNPSRTIQVVLVAEGVNASLQGLDPELFPIRIDLIRRRTHGLAKALNKALTQAVAPTVAFCEGSFSLAEGWAESHLKAQQEHKARGAVGVGPVLEVEDGSVRAIAMNKRELDGLQETLRGLSISNLSLPTRRLQAIGGLAPANSRKAMELDLAMRLLLHGLALVALPQAAVRDPRPRDLQSLQPRERDHGRAQVDLCGRNAEAVDLLGLAGLELDELLKRSEAFAKESKGTLLAARELGLIRSSSLRHMDETQQVTAEVVAKLSQLLASLCQGWRLLGIVDGLRAHGVADFPTLLRRSVLGLPGARSAPWIMVARSDFEEEWIGMLSGLIRSPEERPVVLWTESESSYEHPHLMGILAMLRRRASLELQRPAAEVFLLQDHPPRGRMIRFLSASYEWVSAGGPGEEGMAALASLAGLPRTSPDPHTGIPPAPWPLATRAALRLLAWPDWEDPADLDQLFSRFGALLLGRQDCCLCLRRDPRGDPPSEQSADLLSNAFERCLGSDSTLDLLVIDEELDDGQWLRLGQAMDATLWLGSSEQAGRLPWLERLNGTRIDSPMALQRLLDRSDGLDSRSFEVQLLILEPSTPALSEYP